MNYNKDLRNLLTNTLIPLDVVEAINGDDELVKVAMSLPRWLQKKVVNIARGEPLYWGERIVAHSCCITLYIYHSFVLELGRSDMWAIDRTVLPKVYKKLLKVLAECKVPIMIDSYSIYKDAPKSSCTYSAIVKDDDKECYKSQLMEIAKQAGHIYEMDVTENHVVIGIPASIRTMRILWDYNIPYEQFPKLDKQYGTLLQIINHLDRTVSSIYIHKP